MKKEVELELPVDEIAQQLGIEPYAVESGVMSGEITLEQEITTGLFNDKMHKLAQLRFTFGTKVAEFSFPLEE
ncbi:MAG: hypothetical protein HQL54_00365 [Magnetococcales bacterium]|nr:hypothetical protein [Magnetococcales bacterium]